MKAIYSIIILSLACSICNAATISNKGWYGFKTKLTDAKLAGQKNIPANQYLYIIRGMIRLSEKSAPGFSLMTNDPDSEETKRIMDYIYSFAREKKTESTSVK
jgi:hypothetical protein